MRLRFSVAACCTLLLATACCRPPVRGNRLNVLLLTIETTRADHLGAYGYHRETSPRIDRLAAGGALFERASSVSPRTNPSLASLLTSSYPHDHGVRNLLLPLERDQRTLAEVLRDAGYQTGAVQTHPRLRAFMGFDQGFRSYDDRIASHPLAGQSCRTAEAWIRKASESTRPWFLWLHLMDPHWTYDPPRPWRTRFGPDDPRPAEFYRALAERRARIGPAIFRNRMPADEVARYIDFYDAEIRYTDEAIGALLGVLEQLGLRERTIVVLTADHGESLGEHDYFFEHGDFGTEAEIHVPLIIVAPGIPGGVRIPWTVSSIDVAPTLTELLDLPPERSFRGRSLLPMMRDPQDGADRSCFGETGKRFHDENTRRELDGVSGKWRWLRRGPFKLLHVPRADGTVDRLLYDLSTDPAEGQDVWDERPEVARRMGRELDDWLAADTGQEREYRISPEVRQELEALGYLDP